MSPVSSFYSKAHLYTATDHTAQTLDIIAYLCVVGCSQAHGIASHIPCVRLIISAVDARACFWFFVRIYNLLTAVFYSNDNLLASILITEKLRYIDIPVLKLNRGFICFNAYLNNIPITSLYSSMDLCFTLLQYSIRNFNHKAGFFSYSNCLQMTWQMVL